MSLVLKELSLLSQCIGVELKRVVIITADVESKLWETGVLGCHSPQALLHAVCFYI